jgi:arabinose-5-phosphate isomerase
MVVDLICSTPRFIGEDEKVLLAAGREPAVRRLVGGVTLNHVGWASLFGLHCALFGKQADDDEGRFLRAGMTRLGITHEMDLSGSHSSFAHVYVDGAGGRAIYMARGATGELTPEDISAKHAHLLANTELFSTEISQVPLASVRRALELAREAGARTVVDLDVPLADAVPALGSEDDLHAALSNARVIKASLSALAGLVQSADPPAAAAALAERYGAELVILTLGADGAALFDRGRRVSVAAPRVDVVDTTGAGDALLGGLLAGLHLALGTEEALRLGVACGAACCEHVGAFPEDPGTCRTRAEQLFHDLGGGALPAPAPGQSHDTDGATARFLRVASAELARSAEKTDVAAVQAAADLIRDAEARGGRVHVTGIGKPEHVARYAAALLASTGTPSTFLHGTEATHGSVGQLRAGDVLIAISNSGETAELLACVGAARALDAQIIAVTARSDSSLARAANRVLEAPSDDEGGPLGLAPRTSILTQTLALQALSVELQAAKGLTRAEYHARHPHGTLGKLAGD